MEDNYREVKKAEPCLKLIHMDQVEVEEIEWLFYPFIPYGKVTIIQGDPGEGKTTVVLQIIAKLTKGEAILSETSEGKSEEAGVEPINVIYQTAEDGLGDTIKPRLQRVYVCVCVYAGQCLYWHLPAMILHMNFFIRFLHQ